ncbi:hypothetical protein DO72_5581 [Burkholderia pseudomallei]|nr:hypothetical protein DO72_5581 [Burkholderia pseudomallei]
MIARHSNRAACRENAREGRGSGGARVGGALCGLGAVDRWIGESRAANAE